MISLYISIMFRVHTAQLPQLNGWQGGQSAHLFCNNINNNVFFFVFYNRLYVRYIY